jgi:hypothetical protein
MTTTTSWAVVDERGEIVDVRLWTENKTQVKNDYCYDNRRMTFPRKYKVIPVTIKPKEDGE